MDEMGQELPAFVGGLPRKKDAAQTVDFRLPSQQERPDRSEGDGDAVRAGGPAAGARQAAVGGVEPIDRLFSDRFFAHQAMIQHRVVSGEPQEADLEEAEDRLRGGALFNQKKKIVQELE